VSGLLAAWAGVVHRHRRLVLACATVAVVAALVGVAAGADYSGNNSLQTESSRASDLIAAEMPHGSPSFTLVASSVALSVGGASFRSALDAALAPLASDPRVTAITTPYSAGGGVDRQRVSADSHHALVTIALVDGATQTYREVRARITSPTLQLLATGSQPVQSDYNRITGDDASRGERLSVPLSLLLLFLVFGSLVAAALPLAVAIFATLGGLALLALLTRVMDVDSSASNVTIFLGLGLGIDYSLFIVSRFREELRRGRDVEHALRVTYATAGTAITVSGLTVAIGFSGLLFFTNTWMVAFGLAVVGVVVLSVLAALCLLPALLSLLGPGVDRGRLWRRRQRPDEEGFWHRLATGVMRHPVAVLLPAAVALLLPLASFVQIKTGTDHLTNLPASAESRQGAELVTAQFPQTAQTQVAAVVRWPQGGGLTAERTAQVSDLGRRLAALPGVQRVDPAAGRDIVVLRVSSSATERSVAARNLVAAVRSTAAPPDAEMLVSGATASDVDFVDYINSRVPIAMGFVVLMTYIVLFMLFGSVLLPLKAVVMNLLSITASFGALTWVFVQGHLSGVLGFTPAPIDPVLPVILFCVLFGLSMDYEVFLLTRIQEEYQRTGDTRRAIASGLERNGRLVTGAALIMVVVTASFGFADVVVVKIIGLGAALAILLDATVVRALVVPALMCLMGRANWWAPRGMLSVRRRLGDALLRRREARAEPARAS
jgi:putative drug exporter of the RND superfamily